MKARDYIIEHIPTMVRDEHVAGMKLTTLVALLNGYHEREVKKLNIPDVSHQLPDCPSCNSKMEESHIVYCCPECHTILR